jgi:transcriptional regulator GlxA family with amidase domain
MGNKISEYRKTYQKVLKICNLKERRLGYDIVSYVVDNHKEELHARRVAEQFGISLTDLNRILLFHTERNFTDFLNYLRINSACELLVATELPLVDIAVEVGYNTVKTFTRNFVYYKQMNPSSYRKTVTLGD